MICSRLAFPGSVEFLLINVEGVAIFKSQNWHFENKIWTV